MGFQWRQLFDVARHAAKGERAMNVSIQRSVSRRSRP
jgi:hypothetical protein